jgi:hypothetical protein
MKTYAVLVAALLFTSLGSAQEVKYFSDLRYHQKANLEKAVDHFTECLKSSNEGVVESALAHIARMKLYLPERRFDSLAERICLLSTEGPTPRIRYEAYLVCSLFTTTALFSAESRMEFNDPGELFTALSRKLQENLTGLAAGGER